MLILDMDGVFADFNYAACIANGLNPIEPTHWNWYEEHGLTTDEFWDNVHDYGDAFYGKMVPPYLWKDELLALLYDHCGRTGDEMAIMSAPSSHPVGYAGKKIWCDKHLPGIPLIVGSEKHLLARPGRTLIDDRNENIDQFWNAGGQTIMFPQPWNRLNDPFNLAPGGRLNHVRSVLEFFRLRSVG